ncbi:MAG: nitroreductase family protein [Acidobacteria bacterium]|nr:nitroreductase family protein [Acidobacteriota bacterium]
MDATGLMELIRARRSVRRYDGRPVGRDKVRLMLEALRLAPSSCNTQPWRVVAVDRPEVIGKLAECAPAGTRVNRWMATAPLVFVLCARPHTFVHKAARLAGSDCHPLDMGIAGEHLCLMAAALGLGSCWVGWFSPRPVRRLLGIPRAVEISALIPVGYPAGGGETEPPGAGGTGPAVIGETPAAGGAARRNPLETMAWMNRYEGDPV